MSTDWIICISTVVLVIITGVYVILTHKTLTETRRQAALTQDPVIRVLPEEDVKGEIAKFDLEITNTGIADVSDVRIYKDYFVSLTPPQGPITLNRFGVFIWILEGCKVSELLSLMCRLSNFNTSFI